MWPPKRQRKAWDDKMMKQAIDHVRSQKMGYHQASQHFQVPFSTLRALCQKTGLAKVKLGRPRKSNSNVPVINNMGNTSNSQKNRPILPKTWNDVEMEQAIEHVKWNKMGYQEAALYFKVPETILRHMCLEKSGN